MILIWREDTNPDVWTLASLTNYLELGGLKANLYTPAPHPFPPSTVEIHTDPEPPDSFFAGPVFVVSAELRALLDEFMVKAEFLELETSHKGKKYTKRRYYFANILDSVACLDYEKSEYENTPFGVTGIDKLALDESKAVGHHLFMLGPIRSATAPNPKAIRDVVICASQALATRVIEKRLTGVVFTKPEDRRTYPPPGWKPN